MNNPQLGLTKRQQIEAGTYLPKNHISRVEMEKEQKDKERHDNLSNGKRRYNSNTPNHK